LPRLTREERDWLLSLERLPQEELERRFQPQKYAERLSEWDRLSYLASLADSLGAPEHTMNIPLGFSVQWLIRAMDEQEIRVLRSLGCDM